MSKKQVIADSLFVIQIICIVVFGGGQLLRMLTTAQGVSITWFVCWEAFLLLNLVLTIRAHRNGPSRVTIQNIFSYFLWVVVVTLALVVMVWRGTGTWNGRDTATVVLVIVSIVIALRTMRQKQLTVADPIVKGYFALFLKAIPQSIMALNIFMIGSEGLATTTVVAGHVAVLTRLGQLWFSIREAGWDRNRTGSAMSEVGNEASWIVVTIVWIFV